MTDYLSAVMRSTRTERAAMLPSLGWKLANGRWQSPHTGRNYDLNGAIDIEVLRRTFAKDKERAYEKIHPRNERRRSTWTTQ